MYDYDILNVLITGVEPNFEGKLPHIALGAIAFHVPEDAPAGYTIGNSLVKIFPEEYHSNLAFAISDVDQRKVLSISEHSGQLKVRKSILDYEESSQLSIHVTATYMGNWSQTFAITINIDDVIDEPPTFLQDRYSVELQQNTLVGTKLLQLEIHDRDRGDTHRVSILKSHPTKGEILFTIDHSTQSVVLNRGMNHSDIGHYELLIIAQDLANLTAEALVSITVLDSAIVKMVEEYFENLYVGENTIPNGALADLCVSGATSCSIVSPSSDFFLIDSNSLSLWLVQELDYEYMKSVNVTIVCVDDSDQTVALYYFVIIVNDLNDNAPVFSANHPTFVLPENLEPGHARLKIKAFDVDSQVNGEVTQYYLNPPSTDFSIIFDSSSAEHYITNSRSLDFEQQNSYDLHVFARDSGGLVSHTPLEVKVNVIDQNEHCPEFNQQKYSISASTDHHGILTQIAAIDRDRAVSPSTIQHHLFLHHGQHSTNALSLNSTTGELRFSKQDHSNFLHRYVGYIIAVDGDGIPSLPALLEVNVIDYSKKENVIQQLYNFTVAENTPSGALIGQVACDGCSSFAVVTPAVPFYVNISDGRIFTTDSMDYESDPIHYSFTIATWDALDHQQSDIEITVDLLDVNEHIPIFTRPNFHVTISLNYGMAVDSELLMLFAEDRDKSPVYGRVADYKIVSPLYSNQEYSLPVRVEKTLWNIGASVETSCTFMGGACLLANSY